MESMITRADSKVEKGLIELYPFAVSRFCAMRNLKKDARLLATGQ